MRFAISEIMRDSKGVFCCVWQYLELSYLVCWLSNSVIPQVALGQRSSVCFPTSDIMSDSKGVFCGVWLFLNALRFIPWFDQLFTFVWLVTLARFCIQCITFSVLLRSLVFTSVRLLTYFWLVALARFCIQCITLFGLLRSLVFTSIRLLASFWLVTLACCCIQRIMFFGLLRSLVFTTIRLLSCIFQSDALARLYIYIYIHTKRLWQFNSFGSVFPI